MGLVYTCGCVGTDESCAYHNRKVAAHKTDLVESYDRGNLKIRLNSKHRFGEKAKNKIDLAFLAAGDSVESYALSKLLLKESGYAVSICEPTQLEVTLKNALEAGFNHVNTVQGVLITDHEYSTDEREAVNHFLENSGPFNEFHQMSILFFERCDYSPKAIYLGNQCMFEQYLISQVSRTCALNSLTTRPLCAAELTNSKIFFTTQYDLNFEQLLQSEEPFDKGRQEKSHDQKKNNSSRIRRKQSR